MISGPFFIGTLVGVGCRLMLIGPRLGTLLGTLRPMLTCALWAHVVLLQPYVKMGGFAPNADTEPTFLYVVEQLNKRQLAYLHLMGDQKSADLPDQMKRPWLQARKFYKGRILAGGGFTKESGEMAIAGNEADMIAYGEPFIANPDLVERFRANLPLSPSIRELHYAGGAKGVH
jgi:N-ethylmaleimide reductase